MASTISRPSRVGIPIGARGVALAPRYRETLRALIAREGERKTCLIIGVSRSTQARLVGGMTCIRAVVEAVSRRIDDLVPSVERTRHRTLSGAEYLAELDAGVER